MAGRTGKRRGSRTKRKVVEDDGLVIEDEAAAPEPKKKKRSRSKSGRSSTRERGSSSSRKRSSDDGGARSSARRRRPPAKKDGNQDLVVYLLTALGVLFILGIGVIVLRSGGGTEVRDDRSVIKEAKEFKSKGDEYFRKFNQAESSGNNSDRKKYLNLAKDEYEKCIRKIDELRKVKLYMEANGEFFKAEYGYLEKIQEGAAQNLHDISKRAHTDD